MASQPSPAASKCTSLALSQLIPALAAKEITPTTEEKAASTVTAPANGAANILATSATGMIW